MSLIKVHSHRKKLTGKNIFCCACTLPGERLSACLTKNRPEFENEKNNSSMYFLFVKFSELKWSVRHSSRAF